MNESLLKKKTKAFPKASDFNLTKGYVDAENYTSTAIFDTECKRIFKTSWLCVGELKDLPEIGCYLNKFLPPLKASVIIARSDDDQLRAFYNYCSHRAVMLVEEKKGQAASFRCPYHGWVYNNRGELRGLPCEEDFPHIIKSEHGLTQLAVDTWNGLIFIHAEAEPGETLAEFLGELGVVYDQLPLEKYSHGFSLKQSLDCNWKFMVNAFTEGYHLPFLHNKTLKTQTATKDNPSVHYHDPRFMGSHFISTLERNYSWTPSEPVQSFALSVTSPAHSHSTTGESETREIATHPGVNPSKIENFMMDQVMIFPNTQIQLMLNGYLIHQFWPVAPDKMVMETTIYSATKPTSYREEFAAVYMRASGRDVVTEDSSMSVLQQNNLKSGVVKKLYIGENEPNLRFFAQQLANKMKVETQPCSRLEAIVREFLHMFSVDRIDFDRMEALFNPDAEYQPHPEFSSIKTAKGIRRELERQLSLYDKCDFQIINLSKNSDQVMVERRDYQTQNGVRVEAKVAAIFEFDDQARILKWREYWDLTSIQQQLGITIQEMRTYMDF